MLPLDIPIVTANNERVGKLSSFTNATLTDPKLIEMITFWRNKHRQFFLTQFEATVPRTRQWLEHSILADPTRLMFFIHESSSDPIGHIGVLGLDRKMVELDNMIRGRSGRNGQLMFQAEVALLRWLFNVRLVSGVYLRVLTDNWLTINLHSSVGFKMIETSPLVRKEVNGEVHLVPGTTGGELLETKLGRMELLPDEFARTLPGRGIKR